VSKKNLSQWLSETTELLASGGSWWGTWATSPSPS
jgi:hypothetical protein